MFNISASILCGNFQTSSKATLRISLFLVDIPDNMIFKCSVLHRVFEYFLVDIPDTLDKQAPNVSPRNLWNDKRPISVCLITKLFAKKGGNMVIFIPNTKFHHFDTFDDKTF